MDTMGQNCGRTEEVTFDKMEYLDLPPPPSRLLPSSGRHRLVGRTGAPFGRWWPGSSPSQPHRWTSRQHRWHQGHSWCQSRGARYIASGGRSWKVQKLLISRKPFIVLQAFEQSDKHVFLPAAFGMVRRWLRSSIFHFLGTNYSWFVNVWKFWAKL